MRCQPLGICGIPGKATAKLVINTTINHFIQGKAGLIQRLLIAGIIIVLKQEPDRKGLRKFRCRTKTPVLYGRLFSSVAHKSSEHLPC